MTAVDAANEYANGPRAPERAPEGPPARRVDPLADEIVDRWKKCGEELVKQRRDYWQNLAFFFGEQWVWWDPHRNMLQGFTSQYSPLGKGRARVVSNKVRPNLMSLLGRMLRNDLEFDIPPSDSADDVVAGAMLATDVVNGMYRDNGWRAIRYAENFAKFIGGTSAVCVDWDASVGTRLSVDPQTQAIIGTGDATLSAMAVTEFGVEPGVRDSRKANWWVQGLALHPDYVQSRYRLKWKPSADVGTMMSPVQQKLLEHVGKGQGTNQMCLVITLYEKPNPRTPKGRYAVVVNHHTIIDEPWPFVNRDKLNLFVFHQQEIDSSWIGTTLVNDAVPIQAMYNLVRSVIAEHTKKVGNVRTIAPLGSFDEGDMNDDPGSILFYMPDVGGSKPEYMSPPEIARWLVGEIATLKAELDDVMFVHDTSRGEASFDRASGQALALLSEKDDSPLGLMAFEEAQNWGEIATFILELCESKVQETRRVRIDPGVGKVGAIRQSRWNGTKLRGQTRAFVPLEATLPMSQAAIQAFAKDLWDRKIIVDPAMYARMARLPHRELVDVVDANVAKAIRENARMMEGVAAEPAGFDDHGKHIAEHNRFRMSDSYQFADEMVRNVVDLHVLYHQKLAAEELGAQMMRAGLNPALAQLPQADEPAGSLVPPDFAEQQAGMMGQMGMPGEMGMQSPGGGEMPDETAMQGGSVGLAGMPAGGL